MASSVVLTKNWKPLGSMDAGQYIQVPDDACEVLCMEFSSTYNCYSGVIAITPFRTMSAPNSYFRFRGMTIHLDTSGGNLRVSQDGMQDINGNPMTATVFVYYK